MTISHFWWFDKCPICFSLSLAIDSVESSGNDKLKHIGHGAALLDKTLTRSVDSKLMRLPFTARAVGLLAVSVSLWMAGVGCMFGCSNTALASTALSESQEQGTQTVVAHSCHSQAHDCCAPKARAKTSGVISQTPTLSVLTAVPERMMSDCPLAVNATAAITKASGNAPDSHRMAIAELPNVEKKLLPTDAHSVPIQFQNRAPTHLRCCVFLI